MSGRARGLKESLTVLGSAEYAVVAVVVLGLRRVVSMDGSSRVMSGCVQISGR